MRWSRKVLRCFPAFSPAYHRDLLFQEFAKNESAAARLSPRSVRQAVLRTGTALCPGTQPLAKQAFADEFVQLQARSPCILTYRLLATQS
jgi:hypothetical protein